MPSPSRETERRNFSIRRDASAAIDEFASEHDLTKSKVVEKAVLEYTEEDRTARIEQKVDEILATIEGGGSSPTQTTGKKKNSRSVPDFDPTAYNPDEERDEPLSKPEVKELVALEEPVINPEHIGEDSIPGRVRERADFIAAVVRYNGLEGDLDDADSGHITLAIKRHLGDTDHLHDQYTDSVKEKFATKPALEFDGDEEQYENNSWKYFLTESQRREYYQDRYETIQEAVSTPIDEMPWFDGSKKPYEFLRQWLSDYTISKSLRELEIATDEEINELREELVAYRSDIEDCLTAIEETTEKYSKDFSREEAIEAVPYDEEQSESLISLLDDVAYIRDWDSRRKDMGIDKRRLVWRD